MSTGGRRVAQAFLDGLAHDEQHDYINQMSFRQRNDWWVVERAVHPGRWFHHRGRERYHRDAVGGVAPAVFLEAEARVDACMAAAAAAEAAQQALRLLVPVVESVSGSDSASGSDDSSGSGSGSDSDSPEVIVVED